MGKQIKYGILLEVFGKNTGLIRDVERGLTRVGKAVKGAAFGTGGLKGALGRIGLGGLVSGGLFAPIVGAVKFAVSGALSVLKVGVGAAVGIVRAGVRLVGGIISTGVGLVKTGLKIAGAVAAGAAAGFSLLFRQTARAGDEIAKMAKRTGLSVKFISEMQDVLAKSDATLGDVQTSVRGLGRSVEGAVRGEKEYLDLWKTLGVQMLDTNGKLRSTEALFSDVVDALRRVENPVLRLGLAQRIFGRSGESMIVLVESLTRSLAEQRAEAERLGATWTEKAARAAERAMDAFTSVATALRGLRNAFIQPFLEPVAKSLEGLAGWLATNRTRVGEWGKAAAGAFERAGNAVREKLGGALQWVTSREWKFENVKAGLADLWAVVVQYRENFMRLFAQKGAGGWQMGPLVVGVVAAFEWVADKAGGIFRVLWAETGRDLTAALLQAIANVGRHVIGKAMAAQEARGREVYEGQFHIGALKPWEQLSRQEQEEMIELAGKKFRAFHPVEYQAEKAVMAAGGAMQDLSAGWGIPTKTEREAEAARLRSEYERKAAEDAAAVAKAWAEARALMEAPAAGAGAALGEMAPRKPAAQAAEEEPHPLQLAADRHQRVGDLLAKQGYGPKAQEEYGRRDELLERLRAMREQQADPRWQAMQQPEAKRLQGMRDSWQQVASQRAHEGDTQGAIEAARKATEMQQQLEAFIRTVLEKFEEIAAAMATMGAQLSAARRSLNSLSKARA